MIINFADYSPNAAYHVMTQTVIPRPIAWVLSRNADGISHNLAPFSYFAPISSDPPLVVFSVGKKSDGSDKDTTINCLRERQFVVHIAAEDQLSAVQASAEDLNYGDSEVEHSGLSLTAFDDGRNLQRLTNAPVAFACELYKTDTIGNTPQTLIYAKVKSLYVNDDAIDESSGRMTINADTLAPLARLGAGFYAGISAPTKP